MRKFLGVLGALTVSFLAATASYGQVSTNFSGDVIGNTNFSLTDPNDPGFTATFNSPGEIAFFNNGTFYNGGNRAYALNGGSTADILFNVPADLSITARDTNGTQNTGGASVTEPPATTLGLAVGSAEAFDAGNNSLGVFTFSDTTFGSFTFNGPVSRLELSNTGPDGSYALLGQITAAASAVPEPGSATLILGLAGIAFLRRRRS